ncbi:MAG: hypothetical protein BEN19_01050 [Epulopiscium sp. Nuni2H_MBin003]|nr:MAG: hypothetical protein BEN19_01050 [Epulopiscium sp. Nuni2H_MBin003]
MITDEILTILLKDMTTKQNIIWATDIYNSKYGRRYAKNLQISLQDTKIIMPRIKKSLQDQTRRAKSNAEVFTPSWICNKQNNLIDNAWFGAENMFNYETDTGWQTNPEKIIFPTDKHWKQYIDANRLEITCGEAPYLTSRYDTVTGVQIAIADRIGLLDRKLRIVSENTDTQKEWLKYALKSMQSIYGYDYQGDNVLLARKNILLTILEFYEDKYNMPMEHKQISKFANVIKYNIWQMDGLKFIVPNTCSNIEIVEYTFFGENIVSEKCQGCTKGDNAKHNGTYCTIKDWKENKIIRFIDLATRQ